MNDLLFSVALLACMGIFSLAALITIVMYDGDFSSTLERTLCTAFVVCFVVIGIVFMVSGIEIRINA